MTVCGGVGGRILARLLFKRQKWRGRLFQCSQVHSTVMSQVAWLSRPFFFFFCIETCFSYILTFLFCTLCTAWMNRVDRNTLQNDNIVWNSTPSFIYLSVCLSVCLSVHFQGALILHAFIVKFSASVFSLFLNFKISCFHYVSFVSVWFEGMCIFIYTSILVYWHQNLFFYLISVSTSRWL